MQVSESIAEQLATFGAASLWLFGSRARADHRDDSDADFAVLMRADATVPGLLEQATLANALTDAYGVRSVDLVVLDTASLPMCGRVLVEGKLAWSADDVRRVRFTVDTLSKYFDIQSTIREQDRAYVAAIARQGL